MPTKKGAPVHLKDDFNPFRHAKVVDASAVSKYYSALVMWLYAELPARLHLGLSREETLCHVPSGPYTASATASSSGVRACSWNPWRSSGSPDLRRGLGGSAGSSSASSTWAISDDLLWSSIRLWPSSSCTPWRPVLDHPSSGLTQFLLDAHSSGSTIYDGPSWCSRRLHALYAPYAISAKLPSHAYVAINGGTGERYLC